MSEYPKILGVYSKMAEMDIGTGKTRQDHVQQTYWYVRQMSRGEYEVRAMTTAHVPSEVMATVSEAEFAVGFRPEPEYYRIHTVPAMKSLARKIKSGEDLFEKGLLDEAERQFLKALQFDSSNVEANFGLGAVYSERKDFFKLKKVLKILLDNDRTFQQEQRERFNHFGINLRRNGHYKEAIHYYSKSLEYNDQDENLHFNLARALFDNGQHKDCVKSLSRAVKINPEFKEAKAFLGYCKKRVPEAFAH